MDWMLNYIISAMPAIVGPIINVAILSRPKIKETLIMPIDFGKNFIDNKRVFGDNKTWKGLILSLILCGLISALWGIICKYFSNIGNRNLLYIYYDNTLLFNIIIGMLYGLTYSLFELPNSFLKRRYGIEAGKSSKIKGNKRTFWVMLDQLDSGFGTALVLWYFAKLTVFEYIKAVLLAGILHYLIVKVMCYFKVKENV